MDLSHIPMDAEGIKKFKQEMHEAGIDEIEIGFPPPGSYEHPAFALPYVKSIKYRNTSPITDKPVTEKVTHFSQYSSEDQRLYVQTVFDFFRDDARWPTYRQVEQILRKINRRLNIDDITKELPDGYANSFALHHNLDEEAILSLKAIKECQNSEEVLKDFIKAMGLFADMYYEANIDQMKATGADVHYKFQMPEASVERVGKLLKAEGWLYNSSDVTREESYGSTWQYMITRSINRIDGVTSIDEYLERRDNPDSKTVSSVDQSRTLLGYMYRKAGSEDVKTGTEIWTNDLTKPNEENGAKLEVALLNALTRLGVPVLFGGDIVKIAPATGEKIHSGPQTPVFDLVALNYGSPMHGPTAVLISCKSSKNQPKHIDINLLADESVKVRQLLLGWQVFGALVTLGNPASDDFQYRDDTRIWTQSDLQTILHARAHKYIAQFLWTPPWQWRQAIEIMWRNMYKAHHNDWLQEK